MLSLVSIVVAIAAFTASHYAFDPANTWLCTYLCSSTCSSDDGRTHTGYFEYECAGKPHHSSWSSWWHPERSDGKVFDHDRGAGAITKDWNILYHLGGNGPWVEKVIDVVDGGIAVPAGCAVEQVHMVGDDFDLLKIHRDEANAGIVEDVKAC